MVRVPRITAKPFPPWFVSHEPAHLGNASNPLFLWKYLNLNKKWVPLAIVVVLGAALLLVKRFGKTDNAKPKTRTEKKTDPAADVNRNRGFDRRVSYIEYTQHAKCRMQCRQITQSEVEEIMKDGAINYKKSDVNDRPCPTYALEGITSDNQRVRIVFAQCDLKTKVVTCIDLNTDWECHCPGDDDDSNSHRDKNDRK
jgi:hypothetical protein